MSTHSVLPFVAGADATIPDPGNTGLIAIDRSMAVVELVTAGTETRTVQQPSKSGLWLVIVMKTDGGDCAVTFTGHRINQAANFIATFDTEGDTLVLTSVPYGTAYRWQLILNDGTTLTP